MLWTCNDFRPLCLFTCCLLPLPRISPSLMAGLPLPHEHLESWNSSYLLLYFQNSGEFCSLTELRYRLRVFSRTFCDDRNVLYLCCPIHGNQIKEEGMNCFASAAEAVRIWDNAIRPLFWVESSCLWQNHSYKAREGTGQPGRQSMSGSGKKKSTAGSPAGTNWNWTQLEVMLHAFQMPPWNQFLLYLCKGGAWNKSEITMAPWAFEYDPLEPQCPCWGVPQESPPRGVPMGSENPQVPWIIGKHCAYNYFPERWLSAFTKISMRFINQRRFGTAVLSHISPTMSCMKNVRLRKQKCHFPAHALSQWEVTGGRGGNQGYSL